MKRPSDLRIRRRQGRVFLTLAATAALLAGCSTIRNELGMNKTTPDEFTVVTQAPLVMPPDYSLRPPDNAAPPSRLTPPRQMAAAAVIGAGAAASANEGIEDAGEKEFLAQAGALHVNPDIREIVNSEFAHLSDRSKSFTDRLMFWRKEPPPGTVIDASKEAARLRQNAATGKPVTYGETPTITHHEQGLLEGLF